MRSFRQIAQHCLATFLVSSSALQALPDIPNSNMPLNNNPPYLQGSKNFVYPGIVRYEGEEAGGDHLIGIGRTIGVLVEIQMEGKEVFPLKAEQLQQSIQGLFQEYRINTTQSPPYLPFFYIVIVILPVPQGYAAYVSGRLFEKVQLRDLQFDPSISWQAITWEKETLLVMGAKDVERDITNSAMEISKTFLDRIAFFESLPQQEIPKYNPVIRSTPKTSVPRIKEEDVKLPSTKPKTAQEFKKQKEDLLKQVR